MVDYSIREQIVGEDVCGLETAMRAGYEVLCSKLYPVKAFAEV